MKAAKVKLSITLSRDVVDRIDAEVDARDGASRSSIIEEWLRGARQARAAAALREETIRYYDSLGDEERAEDESIARASTRMARNRRYD